MHATTSASLTLAVLLFSGTAVAAPPSMAELVALVGKAVDGPDVKKMMNRLGPEKSAPGGWLTWPTKGVEIRTRATPRVISEIRLHGPGAQAPMRSYGGAPLSGLGFGKTAQDLGKRLGKPGIKNTPAHMAWTRPGYVYHAHFAGGKVGTVTLSAPDQTISTMRAGVPQDKKLRNAQADRDGPGFLRAMKRVRDPRNAPKTKRTEPWVSYTAHRDLVRYRLLLLPKKCTPCRSAGSLPKLAARGEEGAKAATSCLALPADENATAIKQRLRKHHAGAFDKDAQFVFEGRFRSPCPTSGR